MSEFEPSDANVSVINLSAALNRLGGDRDLLRDMAQFYLEDVPPLLAQVQLSIDANDFSKVALAAHSIKGLSSNFDALEAMEIARQLEIAGREENLDGAAGIFSQLQQAVERVKQALRSEILG